MFFSYIIPSFKKNIGLFICFVVIVLLELVKKDPASIDKYYSSLFYINNSKIFLNLSDFIDMQKKISTLNYSNEKLYLCQDLML